MLNKYSIRLKYYSTINQLERHETPSYKTENGCKNWMKTYNRRNIVTRFHAPRVTETQRWRDIETERPRYIETKIQRDRDTERQGERETERRRQSSREKDISHVH